MAKALHLVDKQYNLSQKGSGRPKCQDVFNNLSMECKRRQNSQLNKKQPMEIS